MTDKEERDDLREQVSQLKEMNEALQNQLDDVADIIQEGQKWAEKRKAKAAKLATDEVVDLTGESA